MAYSNPLNPSTPADGNFLREGDDRIRELKSAIIERLETIFQSLDADPLVFINSVITNSALADTIVGTSKLIDASVTNPKIADGAVTDAKIVGMDGGKLTDGTVANAKLQDNSVTNSKLGDSAVATPELADAAVTTPKIADAAVTATKVADNSLDDTKLAPHLRTNLLKQGYSDVTIGTFTLPDNTPWDSGDIVIPGAVETDVVLVTPKGSQAIGWTNPMKLITYVGIISAPGVAKIRLQNNTGGPIVIPTADWRIVAIRRYSDWYP